VLTSLNLSGNKIGSKRITGLSAALQGNRTLKSIGISVVGVENLKTFLCAFSKNKVLIELNLYGSDFGHEGIALLAEFLKTNKTLGALRLPFCRTEVGNSKNQACQLLIADADVKVLARALLKNRNLALLDLTNNYFSSVGAGALRDAIFDNQAITSLNIETDSSSEGQEILAEIKTLLRGNVKIKLYVATAAYIDLCLRHSPHYKKIISVAEINEEIGRQISLISSEASLAMANQVLEIPLIKV
jgi:Ran GTPase-activating protein (RanGAP) involved in mRNA processing and transport